MIDEGKIKDQVIERLMEEAKKLVGLEVDHLRRLGYVFVADALEGWLPLIEDWDVEVVAFSDQPGVDLSGLPSNEEICNAITASKPLPPHVLANARSEKIHEDKGNLRSSKPLTVDEWAESHRKIDRLRDANGEVLEEGDLVQFEDFPRIYAVAELGSVRQLTPDLEGPFDGANAAIFSRSEVRKLTSLTHEQYLPLARRTMDPELSRKERLSMLALGAMGELKELKEVKEQDPDTHPHKRAHLIEEIGDCCWYLLLLWDELSTYEELFEQGYDTSEIPETAEIAKKVIYHGKDEDRLRRLVKAMIVTVENCIYHTNLPALGEIRLANIKKLIARYPDGFVAGGGER